MWSPSMRLPISWNCVLAFVISSCSVLEAVITWFTVVFAISALLFNSSTIFRMRSVRLLVSSASVRISSDTTANPFPASPARALSIDAFSASRFVWLEIEKICSVISSTVSALEIRLATAETTCSFVSFVWTACICRWSTVCLPSLTAFSELFAIASISSDICLVACIIFWIFPVITVCCSILSALLLFPSAMPLSSEAVESTYWLRVWICSAALVQFCFTEAATFNTSSKSSVLFSFSAWILASFFALLSLEI